MKSFRNFISEEVLPSVQVSDGSLDLRNATVMASINAALASVTAQPAVTPYVVYNRISKLLSQFHIVMPRKFLDGDKGVEVFEVNQFGHKMGMTDQGEFVHDVPVTFYLFLQYNMSPSLVSFTSVDPSILSTGGMFKVTAKIVDKVELNRLLDMAEIVMKEDAECRQNTVKAMAPKEPMHDVTSDPKKVGNKKAVGASEKKSLDEDDAAAREASNLQQKKDADEIVHRMIRGEPPLGRGAADEATPDDVKKARMNETRMPASVIKRKKELADMTDAEKKAKFAGKSEAELKAMARRHGYGPDSNEYSKHGSFEKKQIDELKQSTLRSYIKKAKGEVADIKHFKKHPGQYPAATSDDIKSADRRVKTRTKGIERASDRTNPNQKWYVGEEQIEEGQVTGPRSYKGSPDRKRKAVQMALGRKHKDHPDWNPRTNPQYSALKLGRQLQKQGVKEEKGDRLTPGLPISQQNLKDVAKDLASGQGGASIVSKGDSTRQINISTNADERGNKLGNRAPLDEKLTKRMSAGDVIHDFVHSDDPKFKGKSKKERQKMALGAYYGMHPEKSKKMDEAMGSIKKASAFRTMKRKVSTQVKAGLGAEGDTKTLQVTRKNDPSRKVLRIAKDKFDATKYVKV